MGQGIVVNSLFISNFRGIIVLRKAILKGSTFLVLIVVIISILNSIFILKTGHRNKLIEGLYKHKGNAYDVVMMGSSHMHGGIDPNVLWHQQGITSFVYATGGQPIDVTYYMLKEVLKRHNNPIVVVDLYYLGLIDEYGKEGYVRNALDNMNFSLNKLIAIMNCTPRQDRINYLVPIMKYHDRWKELTVQDFFYDSSTDYYAKGFVAGTDKYGKDNSSVLTTETVDLPPKSEEYLIKIIELSRKEGFKLIFTNLPHDYNSTVDVEYWIKEPGKMFNKVTELVNENDIPFINYNAKLTEIGFDFKADMNNSSHLSIWGAKKVTVDFGKFLKENYSLVDHRSDDQYAQWNIDYTHSQAASISAQN